MFNRIWKEQIAQGKSKLGIWKPKHELRPRKEEEDDDDCLERLQRAVDEIRTHTMLFGLDQNIDARGIMGRINPIDNETACKVLELFSDNPNPFDGSGEGTQYNINRPNREPIFVAIRRTNIEYDGDIRGVFVVYIHGYGDILRVSVFKSHTGHPKKASDFEKAIEQRLNTFWNFLARA